MKESYFQSKVRDNLKSLGCVVIKMGQDATTQHGIPDVLFLHGTQYGFVECKRKKPSPSDYRPLQPEWLKLLNNMSFARVAYPDNWPEVLQEIKEFLKEE